MNMMGIKAIAKDCGVKSRNLKKIELVQALQAAGGNEHFWYWKSGWMRTERVSLESLLQLIGLPFIIPSE